MMMRKAGRPFAAVFGIFFAVFLLCTSVLAGELVDMQKNDAQTGTEEATREEDETMRILFIGNSHTYVNDMPAIFQEIAEAEGYQVEVTMLAQSRFYLLEHVQMPDTAFNIRYGNYDYVVLQEHAHPFGPVEEYVQGASDLNAWAVEAGARVVLYETWSQKNDSDGQAEITKANQDLAETLGAVLAPVGTRWWEKIEEDPEIELYASDGAHASPEGSRLAAQVIWESIRNDRADSTK